MFAVSIILFIVAIYALSRASIILINSLVSLARHFELKEFVVSFVILGVATSLPELFVTISSAFVNAGTLSFGTIIGSNIINITLVVGIVTLFARKSFLIPKLFVQDVWLIFFVSLMPFALTADGYFSRIDALVLFLLYGWYLSRLAQNYRKPDEVYDHDGKQSKKQLMNTFGKMLAGIGLLLASSFVLVETSERITAFLNLELTVFGIFFVAIATNLPEIVFGLRSMVEGHQEMVFGNVLGSVAVNSVFVLPFAAAIAPFDIIYTPQILFAFFSFLMIFWSFNLMVTRKKEVLGRNDALLLLMFYVIFVLISTFVI